MIIGKISKTTECQLKENVTNPVFLNFYESSLPFTHSLAKGSIHTPLISYFSIIAVSPLDARVPGPLLTALTLA